MLGLSWNRGPEEVRIMADKDDIGYMKYAQIGLQLAAGVGLGFWAGYRLDALLGTAPWLMLGGAAAGLAAGFYLMIRELPGENDPARRGKGGPP